MHSVGFLYIHSEQVMERVRRMEVGGGVYSWPQSMTNTHILCDVLPFLDNIDNMDCIFIFKAVVL